MSIRKFAKIVDLPQDTIRGNIKVLEKMLNIKVIEN